jgi:uncharacterized protein YjbI with pentapeptide repeats
VATQAEIEKIGAMREKGTITPEQAEELITALSGEDRAERDAHDAAGAEAEPGDEWDRHRFRSKRFHRGKWVPGWAEDMVGGIASGVREGLGREEYDPVTGSYEYRYSYDWDPSRYWRRMGMNAQDVSRIERPEGESFEFQDNKFAFSRLRSIHLVRSTVKGNAFYAATVHDLEMEDSTLLDGSFAGASLHDLAMTGSEMKNVRFDGVKVKELTIRGNSSIKATKISGGHISSLELTHGSRIEGADIAGVKIADIRLSGSELAGLVLKGMYMQDWNIEGSKLNGCRIEKIGMKDVCIKNSVLIGVVFRQEVEGIFNRTRDLSIEDSSLESCEFIECIIRDTKIKGITAKGLKIHGKDLTGLTFEKTEDLVALAEK